MVKKQNLAVLIREPGYSLYAANPGGNMTYFLHSPGQVVSTALHKKIFETYPEFEQGGVIARPKHASSVARLEMSGGEFSGNGLLAFAALIISDFLNERNLAATGRFGGVRRVNGGFTLSLEISGCDKPLQAWINAAPDGLHVKAEMPALSVSAVRLDQKTEVKEFSGLVDIVTLPGIVHILARTPGYQEALNIPKFLGRVLAAEKFDAAGHIAYSLQGEACRIWPTVWVPSSGTCVRENSCGSGSLAVAYAALLRGKKEALELNVFQPSNALLRVRAEISRSELSGSIAGDVRRPFKLL